MHFGVIAGLLVGEPVQLAVFGSEHLILLYWKELKDEIFRKNKAYSMYTSRDFRIGHLKNENTAVKIF